MLRFSSLGKVKTSAFACSRSRIQLRPERLSPGRRRLVRHDHQEREEVERRGGLPEAGPEEVRC